jgi:hypothetical protein
LLTARVRLWVDMVKKKLYINTDKFARMSVGPGRSECVAIPEAGPLRFQCAFVQRRRRLGPSARRRRATKRWWRKLELSWEARELAKRRHQKYKSQTKARDADQPSRGKIHARPHISDSSDSEDWDLPVKDAVAMVARQKSWDLPSDSSSDEEEKFKDEVIIVPRQESTG